ncbi:MAG TPA: NapC/NirT family cytochrome c [Candidatus Acidoferrales bacterium]|nr:NapC/NirT family cytochrome c [Candidatus Acidoferrales bacterium]
MGPTEILVALIVLTIVLAAVFFVRPSITAGVTGKILAFLALCALPAMCIAAGMSAHMQRSEQTKFCVSCHSMENYGKSLYVDDPSYVAAQHFQNHRVPADMACYACHTDYTIYGPMKDKLKGLTRIYMQYISTPPQTIHILGGYSNFQCLHCHAGARSFEENPVHIAIMDSLKTNQTSCISGGCHDTVHNASKVSQLKMWRRGQ